MDAESIFVDTNMLVYANVAETPLHKPALEAINSAYQAGRTLWISRQVIREYLATLTRPQVFETLPKDLVFNQVDQFIERFEVADDTTAVTRQLIKLLGQIKSEGSKSMMPILWRQCLSMRLLVY